jgi:hypothetical protein
MPRQFENLRASELYCTRCKASRPVRERLLLVLPHAEIFDYRCTTCGDSLGSREVKAGPLAAAQAAQAAARRRKPHGYLPGK